MKAKGEINNMELTKEMFQKLQNQIEELKKEIKILKANNTKKLLAELSVGDEFRLARATWKILDITDTGYMCLAEPIGNKKFDSDDNNWKTSGLRSYLNKEFLEKIEEEIGIGNVLEFERNLLSLDGQTEYGTCIDKVSLLTVDEYRKYRKYIPNADKWWWLITPWSTPCNNYSSTVTVISPSGHVGSRNFNRDCGVRPFCILNSNIFVSKGE